MQKTDRRKFTRVPYCREAIISSRGIRVRGNIENLSLNGVLVKATSCELEFARDVEVEIFMAEPASDVSIILTGTVARLTPEGVAVRFTGMYLDVFERLRDIVAGGLGSKRKVLEEFLDYMAS